MSRFAAAFVLSAIALIGGTVLPITPVHAGGEVLDRGPSRSHRHHVRRITLVKEVPVVRYVDPVLSDPVLPANAASRVRRGNFHGHFVGGNYAYTSAYQDVLTSTKNRYLEAYQVTPFISADLVDPGLSETAYDPGARYGLSKSVPEHDGGGIYDKMTSLMPAPTRGIVYENRTRDAYLYHYDYETENPACWRQQTVSSPGDVQVRSVWTCAGH